MLSYFGFQYRDMGQVKWDSPYLSDGDYIVIRGYQRTINTTPAGDSGQKTASVCLNQFDCIPGDRSPTRFPFLIVIARNSQ